MPIIAIDSLASFQWLNDQKDLMLSQVLAWCQINSGSYHIAGLKTMAKALKPLFQEKLNCESQELVLPPFETINDQGELHHQTTGPLLRFWKRPQAPIQILLVGHYDTVFGIEHAFQQCSQLTPEILQGPGVADMKGGLVVMLWALQAFEQTDYKDALGFEILLTPDEEIGSPASSSILASRAPHHKLGLVYEPALNETGMLAGERKGSANFTLMVQGKAAHAGRNFHEGRNAIAALAEAITALHALNGQHPEVTFNIGVVTGGTAVNIVPDQALCRFNIRFTKPQDMPWIEQALANIVEKLSKKEGIIAKLHGRFTRPPKIFNEETLKVYQWAADIGKTLGHNLSWQPSGGCCDGNNLAAAGLINIDTLGVCGGGLHSAQEHLHISSLVSRAQLTLGLLVNLSQNQPI